MPLKRMVMEIGMGTDIRGADYTKAAGGAVVAGGLPPYLERCGGVGDAGGG